MYNICEHEYTIIDICRCMLLYVQFVNLRMLDLSGNHITHVDNLHANKVLSVCVCNVLRKMNTKH